MKMLLTLKVWMVKESFFTVIDTFEDEQSAMRIVTMMMMMMLLHEVLKGNQNVGAQTQDHRSAQLSS